jgi:recombination protein RecA
MAEAKSLAEKLKAIDKIAEGINKKAGKSIVGRLGANNDLIEKIGVKFISTPSQNVNTALGGGFPRGRSTIIAGMPDSGKTSLVLETIGQHMKEDPNFVAGWLESEHSLEINYLTKTFGIDPNRFVYIEHEHKGAGEAALNEIEAIIAANVCDIVCINSLKCLVPSEEFNKGFEQLHSTPRLTK